VAQQAEKGAQKVAQKKAKKVLEATKMQGELSKMKPKKRSMQGNFLAYIQ
jgi:hypothetical protein